MYYTPKQTTGDRLTIRLADEDDREPLRRLAERDSTDLPPGRILVASVGEEIRAALPVDGGHAIADPFHPTADLIRMLRVRAVQLRGRGGVAGLIGRLRRRSGSLSPQPAGTLRALSAPGARQC